MVSGTRALEIAVRLGDVRLRIAETGDLVADIETGLKLNQINPSNYPAQPTQMGKTRAQVMAETAEARRLGQ